MLRKKPHPGFIPNYAYVVRRIKMGPAFAKGGPDRNILRYIEIRLTKRSDATVIFPK